MTAAPPAVAKGPTHARLYGLLTLMVGFWALNFVIAKVALRELPPLFVAGMRTILSGVFIWPLYFWRARRMEPHEKWRGADVPMLIGVGILGVVLNQFFFVIGIGRTSVAHASIVIALSPMLVLLTAALTGQEHLTRKKVFGMLVAASGVALLQLGRSSTHGPSLLGDLFVFLSGSTFAIYTVFGKQLTGRHGSVTINTFAYVGGAFCLLPLTVWQGFHHNVSDASVLAWLSVVYMSLFPSVISYLIYSYALAYLPASRVSAFSYLQPLMATVLAAVFLSEMPGAGFLAGGALVLGGVFITERG